MVLREFVELRACTYVKIEGRYNVADLYRMSHVNKELLVFSGLELRKKPV